MLWYLMTIFVGVRCCGEAPALCFRGDVKILKVTKTEARYESTSRDLSPYGEMARFGRQQQHNRLKQEEQSRFLDSSYGLVCSSGDLIHSSIGFWNILS